MQGVSERARKKKEGRKERGGEKKEKKKGRERETEKQRQWRSGVSRLHILPSVRSSSKVNSDRYRNSIVAQNKSKKIKHV